MSLENRLKIGGSFFAILLGCFFGGFLFEILAIIHFLSILEVTIQISQSSVTPPSGDPGTEGTAKPPGLPDKVKWFLYYILSIVPLSSVGFLRPRDTLLWTCFLVNGTNDSMQFLWGKYCPDWVFSNWKIGSISPKKTFRGYLLGILSSMFLLHQVVSLNYMFILIMLVLASLGDLWMSSLKRKLGIKHYGTMLGSHGGITDRADSFLFSTPFLVFFKNNYVIANEVSKSGTSSLHSVVRDSD